MNKHNTLARQSLTDRDGYVETNHLPVKCFDFSSILEISWFGLPCACCYNHSQWSPISQHYSDTSGRRVVYLCHHCDAIICRICALYIIANRDEQQLGCAWCGSVVDPNFMTRELSIEEQNLPSFRCYANANENIRNWLCQKWPNSMRITHPKYRLSDLYWTDMVNSMGWRFFADIKVILTVQHPKQFRFLMSMMMKDTFSRFQDYQQFAVECVTDFKQLPEHMQTVYHKSRRDRIIVQLSMFLTSRMIKRNSIPKASFFVLRRTILSKFLWKLSAALGICDPSEDQEIDFSDDTI